MLLVAASVPSSDLHAAYLDHLGRTGRGNSAYWQAARTFFKRWPDPAVWAGEPLEVRLSANSATRPIITFLMLHHRLRPGYDFLLERKLSSSWREIKDSPLAGDLDRHQDRAARCDAAGIGALHSRPRPAPHRRHRSDWGGPAVRRPPRPPERGGHAAHGLSAPWMTRRYCVGDMPSNRWKMRVK